MQQQILNSKGEPIILNAMEKKKAEYLQQICNATGYVIPITTLTAIFKQVVEQKFFTLDIAEYVPIAVGNGAFQENILTYRSFAVGDDFEKGLINTGDGNSRLVEADAAIDGITVPIKNWAEKISWTLIALEMAAKSGNWDLVTQKESARKKQWDLGIQRTAFLGLNSNSNVKGLLTQSDVNSNTSLITKKISSMTEAELNTFLIGVLAAYRVNCAYTAMPNRFYIPEDDYNGLAAPSSATYPVRSKLSLLEETFKTITQNANFKILPLAYATQANNVSVSGLNKNRYTLMNYEETSVRMDIPVDYTSTLANTTDGFNFTNVAYGQFTGVKAYRPKEMLYFDWAA